MSKPSDRNQTHKKRTYQRGRWAELRARLALRLTGHRIVAVNYRTPVGEIDVIACRAKTLSVVEVKARANESDAAEAVSATQRARIARATQHFLQHAPAYQNHDVRFDVCLAVGPWRIKWVRDAWRV